MMSYSDTPWTDGLPSLFHLHERFATFIIASGRIELSDRITHLLSRYATT